MSQLNDLLIEDKDTDELRKIIDRIEKNRKGTSSNLYKKIIEIGRIYDNDSKIKSLNFYDDLFVGEKSIFSTLSYLIEAFDKSFNKSKSQYKKFFTIKNIADFDNVKYVMSLHTSFYRFIKIASFLIMKLDPENLVGQKIKANDSNTENKTFSDSEKITNHLQQYFKIFAQYKKFFDRLRGQSTNGILIKGFHHLDLEKENLLAVAKKDNERLDKLHSDAMNQDESSGLDFYTVINSLDLKFTKKFQNTMYMRSFFMFMKRPQQYGNFVSKYYFDILDLNELFKNRMEAAGTPLKSELSANEKKKPSKKNKFKDFKKNLNKIKKSNINFMDALKTFQNSLSELNLTDEQLEQAVRNFVDQSTAKIIKECFLLNENLPAVRWRRNPRLGLNKIVLTCRSDEYKKPLNRTISLSGKKVKDVICLPKSTKPAGQRMKDRKTSLKRWKTLRSKPAQMKRIKFKRKETQRQSKTLRKET